MIPAFARLPAEMGKRMLESEHWYRGFATFSRGDAMLGLFAAGASCVLPQTEREDGMPDSVYKIIELVGTSKESWEKAASSAVERAGQTLRDLRVAEIAELDLQLDAKGKVEAYRAKIKVSFKFEGS